MSNKGAIIFVLVSAFIFIAMSVIIFTFSMTNNINYFKVMLIIDTIVLLSAIVVVKKIK